MWYYKFLKSQKSALLIDKAHTVLFSEPLTIFSKNSIVNVLLGSKYASDENFNLLPLHANYKTGTW